MKYSFSLVSSLISSFLVIASTATAGWAQATRPIPISAARGEQQIVTVEIYPGQGVTLNFRPTGDIVRRAWIDDPSQVTLDFDDPGCMGVGEPGSCAAQVIHLRRIQGLEFPELPSTGTTTLTVLSDAELYTFRLNFPDSGSPAYSILAIQPEPEPQIAPRLIGYD